MTEIMKELLKKYNKGSVQEVIQEVAKVAVGRELNKEEMEKAYSLVALKGNSTANTTSLNKDGTTPANDPGAYKTTAPANETSLQNATITEEELKNIVTESAKKEEVKVPNVVESAEYKALKAQFDEAMSKLNAIEQANKAAEEAKKTALVAARREELTEEFAKDLTDADLLDETKYELAKYKKENMELKKGTVKPSPKPDLSKGAVKPEDGLEEAAVRERIRVMAFGSPENNSEETE